MPIDFQMTSEGSLIFNPVYVLENVNANRRIVGLAFHPKIKVLGIARTVIETNSVATNDKVANVLFGEYRQEILEVLVQVRLPSSDSTPRSPFPRPHPGEATEERASKTVGLPQPCPNEKPRTLRARSLDAGEHAPRSSIPWA